MYHFVGRSIIINKVNLSIFNDNLLMSLIRLQIRIEGIEFTFIVWMIISESLSMIIIIFRMTISESVSTIILV